MSAAASLSATLQSIIYDNRSSRYQYEYAVASPHNVRFESDLFRGHSFSFRPLTVAIRRPFASKKSAVNKKTVKSFSENNKLVLIAVEDPPSDSNGNNSKPNASSLFVSVVLTPQLQADSDNLKLTTPSSVSSDNRSAVDSRSPETLSSLEQSEQNDSASETNLVTKRVKKDRLLPDFILPHKMRISRSSSQGGKASGSGNVERAEASGEKRPKTIFTPVKPTSGPIRTSPCKNNSCSMKEINNASEKLSSNTGKEIVNTSGKSSSNPGKEIIDKLASSSGKEKTSAIENAAEQSGQSIRDESLTEIVYRKEKSPVTKLEDEVAKRSVVESPHSTEGRMRKIKRKSTVDAAPITVKRRVPKKSLNPDFLYFSETLESGLVNVLSNSLSSKYSKLASDQVGIKKSPSKVSAKPRIGDIKPKARSAVSNQEMPSAHGSMLGNVANGLKSAKSSRSEINKINSLNIISQTTVSSSHHLHKDESQERKKFTQLVSRALALDETFQGSGKRMYHCPVCESQFDSISTRKGHLLIHTNYAPFKCSFCGKKFKRKTHLTQHLNTDVHKLELQAAGQYPVRNDRKKRTAASQKEANKEEQAEGDVQNSVKSVVKDTESKHAEQLKSVVKKIGSKQAEQLKSVGKKTESKQTEQLTNSPDGIVQTLSAGSPTKKNKTLVHTTSRSPTKGGNSLAHTMALKLKQRALAIRTGKSSRLSISPTKKHPLSLSPKKDAHTKEKSVSTSKSTSPDKNFDNFLKSISYLMTPDESRTTRNKGEKHKLKLRSGKAIILRKVAGDSTAVPPELLPAPSILKKSPQKVSSSSPYKKSPTNLEAPANDAMEGDESTTESATANLKVVSNEVELETAAEAESSAAATLRKLPASMVRTRRCPMCDASFATDYSFGQHLMSDAHRRRLVALGLPRRRAMTCHSCRKTYATAADYNIGQHLLSVAHTMRAKKSRNKQNQLRLSDWKVPTKKLSKKEVTEKKDCDEEQADQLDGIVTSDVDIDVLDNDSAAEDATNCTEQENAIAATETNDLDGDRSTPSDTNTYEKVSSRLEKVIMDRNKRLKTDAKSGSSSLRAKDSNSSPRPEKITIKKLQKKAQSSQEMTEQQDVTPESDLDQTRPQSSNNNKNQGGNNEDTNLDQKEVNETEQESETQMPGGDHESGAEVPSQDREGDDGDSHSDIVVHPGLAEHDYACPYDEAACAAAEAAVAEKAAAAASLRSPKTVDEMVEDSTNHKRKRRFKREYLRLAAHARNLDTLLSGSMFNCPRCPLTFTDRGYRDQHLRTHIDVHPYTCCFCGRKFRKVSYLKKHLLLHSLVLDVVRGETVPSEFSDASKEAGANRPVEEGGCLAEDDNSANSSRELDGSPVTPFRKVKVFVIKRLRKGNKTSATVVDLASSDSDDKNVKVQPRGKSGKFLRKLLTKTGEKNKTRSTTAEFYETNTSGVAKSKLSDVDSETPPSYANSKSKSDEEMRRKRRSKQAKSNKMSRLEREASQKLMAIDAEEQERTNSRNEFKQRPSYIYEEVPSDPEEDVAPKEFVPEILASKRTPKPAKLHRSDEFICLSDAPGIVPLQVPKISALDAGGENSVRNGSVASFASSTSHSDKHNLGKRKAFGRSEKPCSSSSFEGSAKHGVNKRKTSPVQKSESDFESEFDEESSTNLAGERNQRKSETEDMQADRDKAKKGCYFYEEVPSDSEEDVARKEFVPVILDGKRRRTPAKFPEDIITPKTKQSADTVTSKRKMAENIGDSSSTVKSKNRSHSFIDEQKAKQSSKSKSPKRTCTPECEVYTSVRIENGSPTSIKIKRIKTNSAANDCSPTKLVFEATDDIPAYKKLQRLTEYHCVICSERYSSDILFGEHLTSPEHEQNVLANNGSLINTRYCGRCRRWFRRTSDMVFGNHLILGNHDSVDYRRRIGGDGGDVNFGGEYNVYDECDAPDDMTLFDDIPPDGDDDDPPSDAEELLNATTSDAFLQAELSMPPIPESTDDPFSDFQPPSDDPFPGGNNSPRKVKIAAADAVFSGGDAATDTKTVPAAGRAGKKTLVVFGNMCLVCKREFRNDMFLQAHLNSDAHREKVNQQSVVTSGVGGGTKSGLNPASKNSSAVIDHLPKNNLTAVPAQPTKRSTAIVHTGEKPTRADIADKPLTALQHSTDRYELSCVKGWYGGAAAIAEQFPAQEFNIMTFLCDGLSVAADSTAPVVLSPADFDASDCQSECEGVRETATSTSKKKPTREIGIPGGISRRDIQAVASTSRGSAAENRSSQRETKTQQANGGNSHRRETVGKERNDSSDGDSLSQLSESDASSSGYAGSNH